MYSFHLEKAPVVVSVPVFFSVIFRSPKLEPLRACTHPPPHTTKESKHKKRMSYELQPTSVRESELISVGDYSKVVDGARPSWLVDNVLECVLHVIFVFLFVLCFERQSELSLLF